MALYYSLYDDELHNTYEWHIGDSAKSMNDYGRQCISIQADGDELEAIRQQFSNLPISNTRRVVRWTGEMAAFIAMNIQPQDKF
jgi:hypothetical protein